MPRPDRLLCAFALLFLIVAVPQPAASQSTCDETTGRVERPSYRADVIDTNMVYTVYLPPCYDQTDDDYPVIYLMHGSNEDDNQWARLGLIDLLDREIASGALPPLITVFPFANWIGNENRFGADSWGEIFLNQFMPLAESSYRIRASRDWRAIGGISRGGFWAYQIGLRQPILFSAVGGHSAFFDRYHAPPESNPLDLALNAPNIDALRLWLDRGADDYAAPGLDIMHDHLNQRGSAHTYMIFAEGQHNNDYWRQHLETYLDFYTADWRTDVITEATSQPENTPVPEASAEAESTSEATSIAPEENALALYLPVVAFPSLLATLDEAALAAVAAGSYDPRLTLDSVTAAALTDYGVSIHPDTRIVSPDALLNDLWRDRTRFALIGFDALNTRLRVLDVNEVHPLDRDLSVYPFAFASDSPNYQPARLTRVLFSGVTALTRNTIPPLDEFGLVWAAEAIAPYVTAYDYFHTSNEVSFYEGCPAAGEVMFGGSFSFCSRPEHFDLLTLLDVDIVELSGNHNNDYGYEAYLNTLAWYRDNSISTIGGGETVDEARTPLILDHNGGRIALLACNWVGPYYAFASDDAAATGGVRPGAADCRGPWLRETVSALDAENNVVIVTIQYLEVDQYTPTDQNRYDFRAVADWGADVVIGTSSHFPQTFEFYANARGTDSLIHYGLGNLFFDQQFFAGVRFFMDGVYIYEGRVLTVDLFTGLIESQARPRAMDATERENFLYLIFNEYGGM